MQTDIVAVRTPQSSECRFLAVRSELDTTGSDSDHTKLDSCRSSPRRAVSPRPLTLPGLSRGLEAAPKRIPPINIPGMPAQSSPPGPPGPPGPAHVRSYASNMVSGLLSQLGRQVGREAGAVDTADEVTDIDISASTDMEGGRQQGCRGGRPGSRSSQRTVESDSLEENQEAEGK